MNLCWWRRDKEILAQYIQAVEGALEEAKRKLVFPKDGSSSGSDATITMSKLLLNADLIPSDIGKAGPELIACQVKKDVCASWPCIVPGRQGPHGAFRSF